MGYRKLQLNFHLITSTVEIYRELSAKNPDAFHPNLVASLYTCGESLGAMDDRQGALAVVREALETLRPDFFGHPEALADWMKSIISDYFQLCHECGQQCDEAVVGPIADKLQKIQNDI